MAVVKGIKLVGEKTFRFALFLFLSTLVLNQVTYVLH